MAETVEFDEFVRVRSARLLRVAHLLTRDHALAEDLLQTTLARCWRGWHRIEGDPEPYVRAAIVNTYNSWWRRRWHGERPTSQLPDQPHGSVPQQRVDDRDEVWRAMLRLPRQQQTVLVLRYFEDLSEAQIADVMGVSAGAVKGYAAKALAKLRVDPTVSVLAMPEPVAAAVGGERVAAVHERIRVARKARIATVSAAVLVVLALVAGYVVGTRIRNQHPHPVEPSPTSLEFFDGNRVEGILPPTAAVDDDYTVTWTHLSRYPVTFYVLCSAPQSGPVVRYNLKFNGAVWLGDGFCAARQELPREWWTVADTMTWTEDWLETQGMDPGRPSTFGVRFQAPRRPGPRSR